MNFYEWIIRLKDKDSPTGDLAYDIWRDKNFPKTSTKSEIIEYLDSKRVHEDVIDAFNVAWNSYQNYLKNHQE